MTPTREQVHEALVQAFRSGPDPWLEAAADAVMALMDEPQPRVLWEGSTRQFAQSRSRSYIDVNLAEPPGTRVAVVLAEGTADHE